MNIKCGDRVAVKSKIRNVVTGEFDHYFRDGYCFSTKRDMNGTLLTITVMFPQGEVTFSPSDPRLYVFCKHGDDKPEAA